MADFGFEFEKVILAEGGYSNHPDDKGGETYLGISRKNNPDWEGWKYVDAAKVDKFNDMNTKLKNNPYVLQCAKELYKDRYWDVMQLDTINSQDIAHQLFDTAVNMGVSKAIKIAQHIVDDKETGKWSVELRDKLNAL